ncbi:MAG: hypothetical protein V3T83_12805 [Acidobacteriota bacterium]
MRRSVMGILTWAAMAVVTPGISGLGAATQPQTKSGGLLEYIPADTPYVFTNFEPLPEPILARLKSSTGSFWEVYRQILRTAIEEKAKKAKEKGEEADPILNEMADFFMEYLSWEGLESLGFGFQGHMAIYGVSLLPVIRWELEDPGAFKSAVARFEERFGSRAPKRSLEGQDYWVLEGKDGGFCFALVGNSLVATFLPPGLEADLLPVVFGSKKPSPSLAESRRLHEIVRENGYLPYGAGYIDIRRSAEILLGESADEYTKLLQTLGPGGLEIGEACKKEALQVTEAWPMAHLGYTEMTPGRMGFKGVLQTSPELAKQLQGLVDQVPGIGTADDGIFSWGVSLNVAALRDFVAGRAESFRNNPYECKQLSELSGMFNKLESALNEAPPPLFALGLRGLRTVIQSLDFDFESSAPRDLKGYAVVHLDNPSVAFQLMQAAVPGFAGLNLEPNGEPVALPAGLLPPSMPEALIVMTQDALAVSVGAGNLESLQAALRADTLQPTPLLSLGYRLSEFMTVIREQMEAQAAESNDPAKIAETQQLLKILGLYDYLKSFIFNLSFTDEGVVITESLELN